MNALVNHYSRSTGSLHASVTYAEILLRVALESKHTTTRRLRENMRVVLTEMRNAKFEQASRDAVMICPERRNA